MAKKQFKAESKRLLDLMINSIYTNKEIFLREVISNASDAIDKLCYLSLTDDKVGLDRGDFRIDVKVDHEARTVTVSDNGVGMNAQELEQNLGVIAKSGSFAFKKDNDTSAEDLDIIGQFGVGFYSAFMVSQKVTVISRAYGEDTANMWVSSGADGYTVSPCERDAWGTDVIMEIKPSSEEEDYDQFLDSNFLQGIVKKYSDYVRWPIYMDVTRSSYEETGEKDDKGEPKKEWRDHTENEVVNSRVPIWQRPKNEVPEEDCRAFYKERFYDTEDPVSVIRVSAEGTVSYKAMLFIPARAPYNYYSKDYQAGLQLFSSGVMIMEHCDALLPEHFRFVRGVVESPDLSLNISREMLQHDRQLKIIANSIEKKIKNELERLLSVEPDKYEKFYAAFGTQLKYGILNTYGANKESLQDLLLFWSAENGKPITLKSYTDAMGAEQKYIYYAIGADRDALGTLPQAEPVRKKGYDILYLTEDADEFLVRMLGDYGGKRFCSVSSDDLGLETDEEKSEIDRLETDSRELLDFIKESLGGAVAAVKLSHKLVSHPVCLTTQGPVTLEMERYFAAVPAEMGAPLKAERVLELNAEHPAFAALKSAFETDRERAAKYADILYDQSLLIAGLPVRDATRFSELVCELMK